MAILVVAEHSNQALGDQTARALTAALLLGADVDILVAGYDAQPAADAAATLAGVRQVLLIDHLTLEHQLAEPLAATIASVAANYDVIAAAATTSGKNVMPRLAALLDVMVISDVLEVVSADTFKRPIYAGNAIQTVRSSDRVKVVTLRTTAFQPAEAGGKGQIKRMDGATDPAVSRFVENVVAASDRPELVSAKIVVSGGRGVGSKQGFEDLVIPLADKLNAAVGASRAAVDAGYAPNDWQVGQTGKIVAPDLYIAIGISGAIQHVAGMNDARVIVAINKDPDAPIFAIADYGLVGDLFEIVPQLQQLL